MKKWYDTGEAYFTNGKKLNNALLEWLKIRNLSECYTTDAFVFQDSDLYRIGRISEDGEGFIFLDDLCKILWSDGGNTLNKMFINRVRTLKDYVEMYGEDEEEVELYLYDFLAFVLEEGNINEINSEFYKVFDYLFKEADDKNIVRIKGTRLKYLYNCVKRISFSNKLKNYLFELYYLNEEKREVNYKLRYKYYNSQKEREILMKIKTLLDQRIVLIKNSIRIEKGD